ncbi:MAG: copper resistance protein CopC, partial [Acidimicrobiaceae bacterium]
MESQLFQSREVRRGLFGLAFFLLFLVSFSAQPALAHNALVESTPANGAVLESAPTVWTLTYSKDVPLNSASAEIISASGVRTQLPTPTYGVSNK